LFTLGESGLGEMGLGEMGQNPSNSDRTMNKVYNKQRHMSYLTYIVTVCN